MTSIRDEENGQLGGKKLGVQSDSWSPKKLGDENFFENLLFFTITSPIMLKFVQWRKLKTGIGKWYKKKW